MSEYVLTHNELVKNINRAKDTLASQLYQNDLISKEVMEVMCSHTILIAKKGVLGTWWDRLWKKDARAEYFFIAKILNDPNPPDQINLDSQTEEYI